MRLPRAYTFGKGIGAGECRQDRGRKVTGVCSGDRKRDSEIARRVLGKTEEDSEGVQV